MRGGLRCLVGLMLVGTACGPNPPLDIGIKELSSNVAFGGGKQLQAAPLPPIALPVGPPALASIGSLTRGVNPSLFTGTPGPASASCPAPNAFAQPSQVAPDTVHLPPSTASYVYRSSGTYSITGANAKSGLFPGTSARDVANVRETANPVTGEVWYRFDVTDTLGFLSTTTTYTLVPESSLPSSAPAGPGVYISRVQTLYVDGTKEDFTPSNSPGLLLVPFPLSPGGTWNAEGADPKSGIAMAYSGTVGEKTRINACGLPLDAWTIKLNGQVGPSGGPGVFIAPASAITFTADYAIGTQFGGLSLQDAISVSGSTPNGGFEQQTSATTDSSPPAPASGAPSCAWPCSP